MKILVIGGGGREHALVWKIAQSPRVKKIYCAPGNAGITALAECTDKRPDDLAGLVSFASSQKIDLTVVGPELPLAGGIVDEFRKAGLAIFGPTKRAARIEASKVFAKQFMNAYGIPSGKSQSFDSPEKALSYVRQHEFPVVLKADGLAAGKGVVVAYALSEAQEALHRMMTSREFGSAGDRVVIEEFLSGEEATLQVITDGRAVHLMPAAQDHKRLQDGDQGSNTGGMGAYAPAPVITADLQEQIVNQIVNPTLRGLVQEGCPFKGVLYVGLMICREGPRVLEFNCRFGDPEAQVLLPLLESDLVDLMEAVLNERLNQTAACWKSLAAICVVLASPGYPGDFLRGLPVEGLNTVNQLEDVWVFHAGTELRNDHVVTSGGRVLGVTAVGSNLHTARDRAYEATAKIHFEGMHYRRDIGARALRVTG